MLALIEHARDDLLRPVTSSVAFSGPFDAAILSRILGSVRSRSYRRRLERRTKALSQMFEIVKLCKIHCLRTAPLFIENRQEIRRLFRSGIPGWCQLSRSRCEEPVLEDSKRGTSSQTFITAPDRSGPSESSLFSAVMRSQAYALSLFF